MELASPSRDFTFLYNCYIAAGFQTIRRAAVMAGSYGLPPEAAEGEGRCD